MSFDAQIAFPCPHVIGEEVVSLSADRRRVSTSRPIAGTGVLELRANGGQIVSPNTGLATAAVLVASRPGPYAITPSSRQLTVSTGTGSFNVTLDTGYRTADEVVSAIRRAAGGAVEAASPFGYLRLEDRSRQGVSSRLIVSGSARSALGYARQWGATGHQAIPPWSLYVLPDLGPGSEGGYRIEFSSPLLGSPRLTLTYSVAPRLCVRCRGTEVENDLRYDLAGEVRRVEGANLLYQSVLKILLTELRSNIYYPWYGSALAGVVGSKSGLGTAAALRSAAMKALDNLMALQATQAKYQRVTAEERLFAVDGVAVFPAEQDPTVFLVEVSVRNYSSQPVDISIVYTTPGTFALPGTNGLALGNPG